MYPAEIKGVSAVVPRKQREWAGESSRVDRLKSPKGRNLKSKTFTLKGHRCQFARKKRIRAEKEKEAE